MSALLMGSRWKQKQLEQGLMDIDSELFKKDKEREKEKDMANNEKEPEKEKEKEKEPEERHDQTTDRVMEEESLCPELLLACVLENDCEKVDILLLRYNFNPNLKSSNGSTPLHLAAWRGYLAIVFCLIQYGADVNIRQDNTGWTALHLALRFGHEDVASALIAAGASVGVIDSYGCSSMTFAALGGKLSTMQFLISQRLDVNHLPKGDGKQPLPAGYDCPPLHTVSGSGNLPLVECLIVEGKADINKRDSVMRTPLMYAVRSNHVEVVRFLLNHGARVNLYDAKGKTALHYAAKKGDQELIDELLNAKADIYKKDNEGLTPLDKLTNDEDGSKRAHMVEIVERRKQRLIQNVIYTSMVGVATGMAIYFGKH